LPAASSSLPGTPGLSTVGAGRASSPIWPCSGWGLPCRRRHRRRGGLLHHRFTLACPPRGVIGGLFSVALSVASRRPAVSRHPALRSSDFPRPPRTGRWDGRDPHSLPRHFKQPNRRHKPRRPPVGAGGVRIEGFRDKEIYRITARQSTGCGPWSWVIRSAHYPGPDKSTGRGRGSSEVPTTPGGLTGRTRSEAHASNRRRGVVVPPGPPCGQRTRRPGVHDAAAVGGGRPEQSRPADRALSGAACRAPRCARRSRPPRCGRCSPLRCPLAR